MCVHARRVSATVVGSGTFGDKCLNPSTRMEHHPSDLRRASHDPPDAGPALVRRPEDVLGIPAGCRIARRAGASARAPETPAGRVAVVAGAVGQGGAAPAAPEPGPHWWWTSLSGAVGAFGAPQ